ncbi:hypothetical protein [Pigmentiphaga daeguensis]|uniref:PIN domain-containing protein n=1 Tax=Pigmentiphaga daeguensis TaxID=414049 RepID=A0ABP3LYZ0_9BURK
MTFSSCLNDRDEAVVLDASVIINLLATGNASAILQALPAVPFVTGNVVREIGQGVANDRSEPALLAKLISDQVLRVEELSGPSLQHFFDMVAGHTSTSLGDGEAATLAYAYSKGFPVAIDEKKATRIAYERFKQLKLVTTIDILAYQAVNTLLGHDALAHATLQALRLARMQVWDHQFEWVIQLIGPEHAAACSSLKRHMRRKSAMLDLKQA